MTASLPLPDDHLPDASASGDQAPVVEPVAEDRAPRPALAPRAAAKDGATASAPRRTPARRPAAGRTASGAKTARPARTTSKTATSKTATSKTARSEPAAAPAPDPGPPPPLPSDLVAPADLVIPPKPPLPPIVESDESAVAPEAVEPAIVEDETEQDALEDETAQEVVEIEGEPEVVEDEKQQDVVEIEPDVVEPEPEPEPAPAIVIEPDLDGEPVADVPALTLRGVSKSFGGAVAVDAIDLTVPAGSFYGLVGPNGAGKTTTLSMIAGLLRPDRGTISVGGVDSVQRPADAKRRMGVLPDRLRTFDRLTGRQLLYYYGVLRGLPSAVVESRTADLARAFDLVDALGRSVSDYSAGMTKKVMLAGAMIHSPRVLVLDEPFESVDPVSSAVILDILTTYVDHGGTVILSSHGMELVERVCSGVAVLVAGQVLAEGSVAEVRGASTLEERFIELAGGLGEAEGLEWLHTFSD